MDYHKDILDAPEKKQINPRRIYLLPAIIIGVLLNFFCWIIFETAFRMIELDVRAVDKLIRLFVSFLLVSIFSVVFLKIMRFEKMKIIPLVLVGGLVLFLGMMVYLFIAEEGHWPSILDKPHIRGYPALSLLVLENAILWSWIIILKQKNKISGILVLILILLFGLSNI